MKTIEELEALVEIVTRERDELRTWQVQIAEPLGYLVRAWGVDGYDVAEPSVIVEAWRALERERDEARTQLGMVEAWHEQMCRSSEKGWAEVERLVHQLADATNETTRVRLEAKRAVEALTDERDELLVRVAEQDAELRATREAYIDAKWTNAYRRGAEAMREACAQVDPYELHRSNAVFARSVDSPASVVRIMQEAIRALPIPEEP